MFEYILSLRLNDIEKGNELILWFKNLA